MIIDIVVGVVALLSALISFMRGFIREVLTIAGVIGGLAAAYFCGPWLSPIFRNWLDVGVEGKPQKLFDIVPMSIVADASAYGAIFVIVVIILSVVSHFMSGAAKAMGLGPIDRTMGVIFGLARALILLGLLYLPFHLLMDKETKDEIFKDSRTHYLIEKTAEFIAGFLPDSDDVEESKDKAVNDIKDKLMEQNILADEKKTDDEAKQDMPSSSEPPPAKTETEGYKEQQREKMNKLFEQPVYNQ
ncbi:MAG: CvpA family protein [Alphaproteobacteria bacterium]|nr:CvpA family protein [Alphaproteobacteria bacterium]